MRNLEKDSKSIKKCIIVLFQIPIEEKETMSKAIQEKFKDLNL